MFTSYAKKCYSSNKNFLSSINGLFPDRSDKVLYLKELCSNCGYPKGIHFHNRAECPTRVEVNYQGYSYLIPEFPLTLIKII